MKVYLLVFLFVAKLNLCWRKEILQKHKLQCFIVVVLEFHRTAFIYAIDNFPVDDKFLKHARFLNFYKQKCSFESVVYVTEKSKNYINFNTDQLNELTQEFLLLQSLNIDNMSPEAKNGAAIRVGSDGNISYRIDILWYHLYKVTILGQIEANFRISLN